MINTTERLLVYLNTIMYLFIINHHDAIVLDVNAGQTPMTAIPVGV